MATNFEKMKLINSAEGVDFFTPDVIRDKRFNFIFHSTSRPGKSLVLSENLKKDKKAIFVIDEKCSLKKSWIMKTQNFTGG